MKKPFISKKAFKRREKKCQFCNEERYELLDSHRIRYGQEYSNQNCVCVCTKCHRLIHNNKIKIIGWKYSTAGKLIHYIDEDGEEKFI